MPTYEYGCSSCGNEWEFEQSIKDEPLKACPKCRKKTAKRQISRGGGFILKGGGWYSDLYASSGNKPADKADAKTDNADAKSETKTETKTETKADTKTESTSTSSTETKTDSSKASSKSVAA